MSFLVCFIEFIFHVWNESWDFCICEIDYFHKNFISNHQTSCLKVFFFEFLFVYGVGLHVVQIFAALLVPAFLGLFQVIPSWWSISDNFLLRSSKQNFCFVGLVVFDTWNRQIGSCGTNISVFMEGQHHHYKILVCL